MSDRKFDIYDIMACDVFWDYGTPGLSKPQHKFLVAFHATKGRWDNIFIERISNPTAGLNRSEVAIGATLKPKASYLYFVEITDSNAMGQTNICIFQPFRRFATPEQQAGVAVQASG